MQIAVVGSGLAALATARALIRRGIKPVVLDAGLTLESNTMAAVERMRAATPADWDRADVDCVTQNRTVGRRGIPRKLVFGSDYIYAHDHSEAGVMGQGNKASTSLAKGGFGNAWGAAILPAPAEDLDEWPVSSSALASHYRAVMSWLPLSAGSDGLLEDFPTHAANFPALELAPQATALRRDLARMTNDRLRFGQARLAVHVSGARACRYCGLCLSGCVYDSIFSPARDLDGLALGQQLEYRPGWLVTRVGETASKVTVQARPLSGGADQAMHFDRVFLAAGALGSTRIVLRSLDAFGERVEFMDSQKFLLPLFRRDAAPYDITSMNSLAALFVEMRIPALDGDWMHMQISSMNDMVLRRLKLEKSVLLQKALSPLLQRTMVAWCSLHSRHSATLIGELRREDTRTSFVLEHANLERARTSTAKAVKYLARQAGGFRCHVSRWLVSLSTPGAGNHIGGSLPMRTKPRTRLETDVMGRPSGFARTHVVDSAILPSVPATTIALLMMANADRIATASPL